MEREPFGSPQLEMQHGGQGSGEKGPASPASPELQEAQDKVKRTKQRLLAAAVAFCDGLISAGQLRAVREMLREQELRVTRLQGKEPSPFVKDRPSNPVSLPVSPATTPASPNSRGIAPRLEPRPEPLPPAVNNELESLLNHLDEKIARLEKDFQQGRVNASQYRAIRRHYLEQHEVALRLHQLNPSSDRWRVVLEEGKTSFLLKLNEAECRCIALYDISTMEPVHVQGELPDEAEEALRFLGTFGPKPSERPSGRMFATQTDDGSNLILIPGRYTASLVAFSDDPPGWQVRALREVLRNFEIANQGALRRGERDTLIIPNLDRFFRH